MISKFVRFRGLIIAFLTSGMLVASPALAHAATNLVINPSVEQANSAGTAPLNWSKNAWGANKATFQYKTNGGYQSSKSVYVSMANYASGDAKWYFNPVAAQPNTTYTFTEAYKANVSTRIVAMSLDAGNAPSYFDVGAAVPASTSWKTGTYSVKTLASTKKLTLFHVIERNGWLQLDAVGLSLSSVPPPVDPTNPVPNYSVEQVSAANASLPASWNHSQWGTNTPQYQYMTEGKDGSRSVKVTMTNHQSGDAKWVFDPQPLTRGGDYKFTAWYKTNTIPHVVAQYIKDDGSEDYFGLPDPEPAATASTTWQQYSDVFSVPQNVKAVSVFFFLNNNGWVQTDDYHIAPYKYTGFSSGMVSLTFDDGFEENITTAIPVLDAYGFKSTQCFATQYVEGQADKIAIVKQIADDGHEICSHTVTHPFLTQLSTTDLTYEITHSQAFLQSIAGHPVTNFASPYGDYNAAVNTELKKYYASHRTTDEGFNSKDNFNAYRLRVQNMTPTTTLAQVQAWVNKAKADHTWLILLYHVVSPDKANMNEYDTYKPDFDAQMKWLSTAGIPVVRWDAALATAKSQL